MYKILFTIALITCGISDASPYMMGKYLRGEISADDYMDSMGVPSQTTIIGPSGETWIMYGR